MQDDRQSWKEAVQKKATRFLTQLIAPHKVTAQTDARCGSHSNNTSRQHTLPSRKASNASAHRGSPDSSRRSGSRRGSSHSNAATRQQTVPYRKVSNTSSRGSRPTETQVAESSMGGAQGPHISPPPASPESVRQPDAGVVSRGSPAEGEQELRNWIESPPSSPVGSHRSSSHSNTGAQQQTVPSREASNTSARSSRPTETQSAGAGRRKANQKAPKSPSRRIRSPLGILRGIFVKSAESPREATDDSQAVESSMGGAQGPYSSPPPVSPEPVRQPDAGVVSGGSPVEGAQELHNWVVSPASSPAGSSHSNAGTRQQTVQSRKASNTNAHGSRPAGTQSAGAGRGKTNQKAPMSTRRRVTSPAGILRGIFVKPTESPLEAADDLQMAESSSGGAEVPHSSKGIDPPTAPHHKPKTSQKSPVSPEPVGQQDAGVVGGRQQTVPSKKASNTSRRDSRQTETQLAGADRVKAAWVSNRGSEDVQQTNQKAPRRKSPSPAGIAKSAKSAESADDAQVAESSMEGAEGPHSSKSIDLPATPHHKPKTSRKPPGSPEPVRQQDAGVVSRGLAVGHAQGLHKRVVSPPSSPAQKPKTSQKLPRSPEPMRQQDDAHGVHRGMFSKSPECPETAEDMEPSAGEKREPRKSVMSPPPAPKQIPKTNQKTPGSPEPVRQQDAGVVSGGSPVGHAQGLHKRVVSPPSSPAQKPKTSQKPRKSVMSPPPAPKQIPKTNQKPPGSPEPVRQQDAGVVSGGSPVGHAQGLHKRVVSPPSSPAQKPKTSQKPRKSVMSPPPAPTQKPKTNQKPPGSPEPVREQDAGVVSGGSPVGHAQGLHKRVVSPPSSPAQKPKTSQKSPRSPEPMRQQDDAHGVHRGMFSKSPECPETAEDMEPSAGEKREPRKSVMSPPPAPKQIPKTNQKPPGSPEPVREQDAGVVSGGSPVGHAHGLHKRVVSPPSSPAQKPKTSQKSPRSPEPMRQQDDAHGVRRGMFSKSPECPETAEDMEPSAGEKREPRKSVRSPPPAPKQIPKTNQKPPGSPEPVRQQDAGVVSGGSPVGHAQGLHKRVVSPPSSPAQKPKTSQKSPRSPEPMRQQDDAHGVRRGMFSKSPECPETAEDMEPSAGEKREPRKSVMSPPPAPTQKPKTNQKPPGSPEPMRQQDTNTGANRGVARAGNLGNTAQQTTPSQKPIKTNQKLPRISPEPARQQNGSTVEDSGGISVEEVLEFVSNDDSRESEQEPEMLSLSERLKFPFIKLAKNAGAVLGVGSTTTPTQEGAATITEGKAPHSQKEWVGSGKVSERSGSGKSSEWVASGKAHRGTSAGGASEAPMPAEDIGLGARVKQKLLLPITKPDPPKAAVGLAGPYEGKKAANDAHSQQGRRKQPTDETDRFRGSKRKEPLFHTEQRRLNQATPEPDKPKEYGTKQSTLHPKPRDINTRRGTKNSVAQQQRPNQAMPESDTAKRRGTKNSVTQQQRPNQAMPELDTPKPRDVNKRQGTKNSVAQQQRPNEAMPESDTAKRRGTKNSVTQQQRPNQAMPELDTPKPRDINKRQGTKNSVAQQQRPNQATPESKPKDFNKKQCIKNREAPQQRPNQAMPELDTPKPTDFNKKLGIKYSVTQQQRPNQALPELDTPKPGDIKKKKRVTIHEDVQEQAGESPAEQEQGVMKSRDMPWRRGSILYEKHQKLNPVSTINTEDLEFLHSLGIDGLEDLAFVVPDEPSLTEAQIDAFKAVFEKFTSSSGGVLDVEALSSTLDSVGISVSPEEVQTALERADYDEDGEVGFQDFLSVMTDSQRFSKCVKADMAELDVCETVFYKALTKMLSAGILPSSTNEEIVQYYHKKTLHLIRQSVRADDDGGHVLMYYSKGAHLIGLSSKQLMKYIKPGPGDNSWQKEHPYLRRPSFLSATSRRLSQNPALMACMGGLKPFKTWKTMEIEERIRQLSIKHPGMETMQMITPVQVKVTLTLLERGRLTYDEIEQILQKSDSGLRGYLRALSEYKRRDAWASWGSLQGHCRRHRTRGFPETFTIYSWSWSACRNLLQPADLDPRRRAPAARTLTRTQPRERQQDREEREEREEDKEVRQEYKRDEDEEERREDEEERQEEEREEDKEEREKEWEDAPPIAETPAVCV